MARALALQARGQGFDSLILHGISTAQPLGGVRVVPGAVLKGAGIVVCPGFFDMIKVMR